MRKSKYFVGKEYNTLKEKNDILQSYDGLQQSKLTFLNEMYDNESTLKGMWSVYKNHIHPFELSSQKDVMFFDDVEVDEIIANRFRLERSTKNNILHFINSYKRWGVDRGDISGNSVEAINRPEAIKSMQKVVMNKVWGLGEFYNLLIKIERTSALSNAIPMLLARYGITGKQMIYARGLRWEDIDYESKRVKIIKDGKLIRYIDVDDRFLEWIEKYKLSNDSDESIDYGYVIKKKTLAKDDSLIDNYNTINTRVYIACKKAEVNRISFGDLLKSRYIDLLLEIRATRKLTTDDVEYVIMCFKDETKMSIIHTIKTFYEALTKDTIMDLKKSKKVSLMEVNSKELVYKIRKEIGFEEFINGENKIENKDVEIELSEEISTDKID